MSPPSLQSHQCQFINQDFSNYFKLKGEEHSPFKDSISSFSYKHSLGSHSIIQTINGFEEINEFSYLMSPNLFSPSKQAWQWGDVLLIISNNRLEIFRLVIGGIPLKDVKITYHYGLNMVATYLLRKPDTSSRKIHRHSSGLMIWGSSGHSFPLLTSKPFLPSWTLRNSDHESATWIIVHNVANPMKKLAMGIPSSELYLPASEKEMFSEYVPSSFIDLKALEGCDAATSELNSGFSNSCDEVDADFEEEDCYNFF